MPGTLRGDGRSAYRATLSVTGFLAVAGRTVYVTDFLNNRVRRIDDGTITTVLGTGEPPGVNGDGPAEGTRFRLGWPSGVVLLDGSTLLVADSGTNRVIRLHPATVPAAPAPGTVAGRAAFACHEARGCATLAGRHPAFTTVGALALALARWP